MEPCLSGSNEINSQLLAGLLWFHIFPPFVIVLMPGPEGDSGSQKEAVCVLISSADE